VKFFEKYKFTDKVHTPVGIMSAILGCIALLFGIAATITPYLIKARSSDRFALTLALSVFMGFIGVILGIIGKTRKGEYGLFPKIGLVLNTVVIVWGIIIITIGAGII